MREEEEDVEEKEDGKKGNEKNKEKGRTLPLDFLIQRPSDNPPFLLTAV